MTLHRLRGYSSNQPPAVTLRDISDEELMLKYFWMCQSCITLRSKICDTDCKNAKSVLLLWFSDQLQRMDSQSSPAEMRSEQQKVLSCLWITQRLTSLRALSSGASAKWTLHYLWTRLTARVSAFTRKSKTLSRFLSLLHPALLSSITSSLSSAAHVSFSWSARATPRLLGFISRKSLPDRDAVRWHNGDNEDASTAVHRDKQVEVRESRLITTSHTAPSVTYTTRAPSHTESSINTRRRTLVDPVWSEEEKAFWRESCAGRFAAECIFMYINPQRSGQSVSESCKWSYVGVFMRRRHHFLPSL